MMKKLKLSVAIIAVTAFSACNGNSSVPKQIVEAAAATDSATVIGQQPEIVVIESPIVLDETPEVTPAPPVPAATQPPEPAPVPPAPAPSPVAKREFTTDLLVYNGSGTASDDTASVVAMAESDGLSVRVVGSSELNGMTSDQLKAFGAIVWPGGKAKTMSDSLTEAARDRVRSAVVDEGLGYIGFCAGAFIAGTYPWNPTWGLELTNFDFPYYYLENEGVSKAMVDVTFPDGASRDLVWYGGPELSTFGSVIAKYPDGTSAIAQERIGKGLVILSGPHPEAPQSWRYGLSDSDGMDTALTQELLQAVLENREQETF